MEQLQWAFTSEVLVALDSHIFKPDFGGTLLHMLLESIARRHFCLASCRLFQVLLEPRALLTDTACRRGRRRTIGAALGSTWNLHNSMDLTRVTKSVVTAVVIFDVDKGCLAKMLCGAFASHSLTLRVSGHLILYVAYCSWLPWFKF